MFYRLPWEEWRNPNLKAIVTRRVLTCLSFLPRPCRGRKDSNDLYTTMLQFYHQSFTWQNTLILDVSSHSTTLRQV